MRPRNDHVTILIMENQTCGKGLAQNSALPAKLGEVIGSVAAVLEMHLKAIDRRDAGSRPEIEAYEMLASEQREIAESLRITAGRMRSYSDLPMAKHDEAAMADPAFAGSFRILVEAKEKLRKYLEETLEGDRAMLKMMTGE